jgi:hypothetical protein
MVTDFLTNSDDSLTAILSICLFCSFNDETVNLILRIAVRESSELVRKSVTMNKSQFEELQAREKAFACF